VRARFAAVATARVPVVACPTSRIAPTCTSPSVEDTNAGVRSTCTPPMNNWPTRCARVSLWRVRCTQLATVGEVVAGGVCDGVVVAEYVLLDVGDAPLADPDR
jgi:hypothetical protein